MKTKQVNYGVTTPEEKSQQLLLGASSDQENVLRAFGFDKPLRDRDALIMESKKWEKLSGLYPDENILTFDQISDLCQTYFLNFKRLCDVEQKAKDTLKIDHLKLADAILEKKAKIGLNNNHDMERQVFILARRNTINNITGFYTKYSKSFTLFFRVDSSDIFVEIYSFGHVEESSNIIPGLLFYNNFTAVLTYLIITSGIWILLSLLPVIPFAIFGAIITILIILFGVSSLATTSESGGPVYLDAIVYHKKLTKGRYSITEYRI